MFFKSKKIKKIEVLEREVELLEKRIRRVEKRIRQVECPHNKTILDGPCYSDTGYECSAGPIKPYYKEKCEHCEKTLKTLTEKEFKIAKAKKLKAELIELSRKK